MVGYDPKKSKNLTQIDFAFAGGASGCITRAVCQPFDVLKIRLQLQVEPINKKIGSKYQSIRHAASLIYKEEGVKALWKGHIPGQWLSIVYGITQFWTFEVLTKKASNLELLGGFSPLMNFSCGAIAGCSATVTSFPFDVIRTRLVAQSENHRVYTGIFDAFKSITKTEGPLVLYRGLWPTFLQVGPHAGIQFMTYKLFDAFYKYLNQTDESTLANSLICGSFAGLCAKVVIYPFDLAKKRMQIQGFEQGRRHFGVLFRCNGLNDCLVAIYRTEGVGGLFKGLGPSLIKAVVATAMHFSCYEMILNILEWNR